MMDNSGGKYLYILSFGTASVIGPVTSLVGFQTSIGVEEALGSTNSVIYGVFFALSSLLLSSSLTAALGRKTTLIIGEAGVIVYTLAMFYPTWGTLIPAAAVVGLSEGIIWSTSGAMVASICFDKKEKEGAKRKQEQNIAIFNAIIAFGQAGSFLLAEAIFTTLQQTEGDGYKYTQKGEDVDALNSTRAYNISQCGANDCPLEYSFEKESSIFKNLIPSKISTYALLSIYGCLQITAVVLHCTLLADDKTPQAMRKEDEATLLADDKIPLAKYDEDEAMHLIQENKASSTLGSFSIVPLQNIAREVFSTRKILTIPVQLQYGLLVTFIWSGFNRAFLSCTIGVEHVGSHEGVINLASFLTSLSLWFLSEKNHPVFENVAALITELSSSIVALYWVPSPENLYMTYVLSTFFGIAQGMRRYVGLSTAATFSQDLDAGYAILGFLFGFSATLNYAWTTPLCVNAIFYLLMSHSVYASVLLSVAHYKYLHIC